MDTKNTHYKNKIFKNNSLNGVTAVTLESRSREN